MPLCDCGHPVLAHCDADGWFHSECAGADCDCTGYIGHSTLILEAGPDG